MPRNSKRCTDFSGQAGSGCDGCNLHEISAVFSLNLRQECVLYLMVSPRRQLLQIRHRREGKTAHLGAIATLDAEKHLAKTIKAAVADPAA